MEAIVELTHTEVTLLTVLLSAVLVLLGWIGRQQIHWMSRIEDKVNDLDKKISIIDAVMKIKHPEDDK